MYTAVLGAAYQPYIQAAVCLLSVALLASAQPSIQPQLLAGAAVGGVA
jgi:hypothetical protein